MPDVLHPRPATTGAGDAADGGARGGVGDPAALRRRMADLAAHIHAAQAEMVELLGRLDDCDGWRHTGVRTIGQWASIELGLDARAVARQLTAARRLRELPAVAVAARAGELGWAKVSVIARVAHESSEANWLALAREMSVGQLQRTAKAYTRARREAARPTWADGDEPDQAPTRRRGVWLFDEPDGLVRVTGLLAPDDAAVLRAALNAQLERSWRADQTRRETGDGSATPAAAQAGPHPTPSHQIAPGAAAPHSTPGHQTAPGADPTAHGGSAPVGQSLAPNTVALRDGDDHTLTNQRDITGTATHGGEPARRDEIDPTRQAADPIGARRADALVDLLRASLDRDDRPDTADDATQVIVHVDVDFLAGITDSGRCHTNHGDGLTRHAARRAACDALIRPLLHDSDGRPLDLGRTTRTVSRAQRRALAIRDDNCCTFPGCTATVGLAAHHLVHWTDGGRTDIDNLALLCRHHHRLHHDGGYSVAMVDGRLRFRRPDGRTIGVPPPAPPDHRRGLPALRAERDRNGHRIDHTTAVARSGGSTDWSLALTLDALFSSEHARRPAA